MNVESVEIGTIANCAKGRCRTIGWIDQQRPWKRLHFLSAVPSQSSCKIVPQINKYQKKPIKCSKRFSKTDWTISHCYCNLFLWRIEVSRRCELSGQTAPTVEPFLSLNETVKMTVEIMIDPFYFIECRQFDWLNVLSSKMVIIDCIKWTYVFGMESSKVLHHKRVRHSTRVQHEIIGTHHKRFRWWARPLSCNIQWRNWRGEWWRTV